MQIKQLKITEDATRKVWWLKLTSKNRMTTSVGASWILFYRRKILVANGEVGLGAAWLLSLIRFQSMEDLEENSKVLKTLGKGSSISFSFYFGGRWIE